MLPRKVAEAALPTGYGEFRIIGFEGVESPQDDEVDSAHDAEDAEARTTEDLVAIVMGTISPDVPTLVRIHSQCLTGDTFGSSRCDCGQQLDMAFRRIAEAGQGVIIYQLAEGRGIGLMNKLAAYELQDRGHDTVEANHQLGFEADERTYAFPASVLRFLGAEKVRLMSNNPRKIAALEEAGFRNVERVPIEVPVSTRSADYLRTKKDKLGHLLSGV